MPVVALLEFWFILAFISMKEKLPLRCLISWLSYSLLLFHNLPCYPKTGTMMIPHTQKIIRIRELRLENILVEEEGLGGLFFLVKDKYLSVCRLRYLDEWREARHDWQVRVKSACRIPTHLTLNCDLLTWSLPRAAWYRVCRRCMCWHWEKSNWV